MTIRYYSLFISNKSIKLVYIEFKQTTLVILQVPMGGYCLTAFNSIKRKHMRIIHLFIYEEQHVHSINLVYHVNQSP